jgi:hypothetical protein
MEDKIKALLSFCSELDFGVVRISDGEKEFYKELNKEILLLCASLPESIQTDALLLFMEFSGISIAQKLNFLSFSYIPSWSAIYWLFQCDLDNKYLKAEDFQNAKASHLMAIYLHYIDHQLCEHNWPLSHLALLLRSQLWTFMKKAFGRLAKLTITIVAFAV